MNARYIVIVYFVPRIGAKVIGDSTVALKIHALPWNIAYRLLIKLSVRVYPNNSSSADDAKRERTACTCQISLNGIKGRIGAKI